MSSTISGNFLNQTISSSRSATVVIGNNNTIGLNGQNNNIVLYGTINTLTVLGDYNGITTSGNNDVLSVTGNGNYIDADGLNDVVTLEGTGLNLSIGNGGRVNLAYGTHATIGSGSETVTQVGGSNVTFNGGPAIFNITGASNTDVVNGDNAAVTIAAGSAADTVTINGQNAKLTIAGGGNWVTTNGTGETLMVTGSNNSLNVNGASGDNVALSNYNNTLVTSGTGVTFANSSGGTVDGGNDTVTIGSTGAVTLNGDGFSTTLSGSDSTVLYGGDYGYLYVTGASDSLTINGGDDVAFVGGSKNKVIISGLAAQVAVSGTSQTVEVNNAIIAVAANSNFTLGNGGGTLYSAGNIVNIGSAASVLVQGAGASNNWLQASSGDIITLAGNGDGVAASGASNTIYVLSTGDVAIVSGSSLSVGSGLALNLTGTSDSVKLSSGSSLMLNGASDSITSSGPGDTISVSGSGDVLSLSSGTINFTGAGNATATTGTGFAVNGFAFPSATLGDFNNAAATTSLAALRATGANSVQLVVTEYVANTTGTSLSTSSGTGLTTESVANLEAEITQAKADGLSVFLAPHINIDNGTWQALLAPSNVATFFANYQTYIVNYAKIAQAYCVTTFSVGDELSSLDGAQYQSYWTTLIAAVRQVYHGTLTYDSAWNDTGNVSFWNQLDEIGANAYVPVTDNITNPTLAQLEAGWTSVNPLDSSITGGVSAIQWYKNLAAEFGKPILFTEAGYQSVNGTNTLTGAIPAAGAAYTDYQQQALAEQAMLTVLKADTTSSWFKGLYLWDWNPQPGQVVAGDFSPQGKPALAVIDAWYQGTEPTTNGLQTGTLTGNSNKVGLGNAVTLTLAGTGNVITLGSGDTIKASGSANIYGVTASQLIAGETIAGTGSDTLVISTAGTFAASVFVNVTGISTIDLAAGNNTLTLSDAQVASATGGSVTVVAGSTGTTVITAAALGATHSVHLTAGTGAATLTGGAGADTLTAGAGADTLTGGGGADSYVYGTGDGATTLINATSLGTAAHGQIDFLSPLTDANLWFIKSGDNLLIDILGSKSVLTVSNWFGTNKSAAVAEIEAGGLKLDSQLSSLITAMATYQTANPTFNPQTATAMPTNTALHNAITAAWHT